MTDFIALFDRGGPVLWIIGALSVLTVGFVLWKAWRLSRLGAWSAGAAEAAVAAWTAGDRAGALTLVEKRSSVRAVVARRAMSVLTEGHLGAEAAREETVRVARAHLLEARSGLRFLDLIVTVAPLLGLFGTVLGMIAAFQALQAAGARPDPTALAGGIWEALLTTAAGMAVAIPASISLSWFDSIADRLQADLEDLATRIFLAGETP